MRKLGPYEIGMVHHADCRDALAVLPDASVQCCVTSPPYWGLRSYDVPETVWDTGLAWPGGPPCEHLFGDDLPAHHPGQVEQTKWKKAKAAGSGQTAASGAFCRICGAWRGQLGLEPTPDLYVKHMVSIFRDVRRVLRDDGTLWLNIGDCYNAGTTADRKPSKTAQHGYWTNENIVKRVGCGDCKPKDLLGMPWLLAFALRADGWYLRAEIIWCLSGGAWVYARTQKGDMPMMVKDLVRLDPRTVKLWNGSRWTRATGWRRSGSDGEHIELVLRSGERIGCTGEHRWPTSRGIVAASNLRAGDVIETCRLPEPDGAWAPPYLGEDACWLAGLYLAEGSRNRDHARNLSLHEDEKRWLDRIDHTVRMLGGTTTHSFKGHGLNVRIFGRVVCAVIDSIVGGRTAIDKHLRPEVWRLPNGHLRAIMDGYLDGDGSTDEPNRRIRLGLCRNYNLERDLRTAAARLGAVITLVPCVVSFQGGRRPAFHGEWRWTRSGHHNEKDRGEVVEIRRSRARKFWDIGVDDEPHLFALASGVLTHNSKTAPMPESVRDRPTRAHEQVFLLSKSGDYFYNEAEAKEPSTGTAHPRGGGLNPKATNTKQDHLGRRYAGFNERWRCKQNASFATACTETVPERNWRTVWTIGPEPNDAQHFAPFPREVARRCIVAGSKVGDVVLDPFAGTGTTVRVADGLGRKAIGFDLGEKYVEQANERSGETSPSTAKLGQQIGLLGETE